MKVHRFKNDPQVLLEQGKAIVKSTPEGRYIQRVVLVNILLTGELGTKELSEISGTPVRTLQCWLKDVDEKGWDTLLDPVRPGRASRLTGEDKKKIKDLITEDNPSAYGYDVWDAKTLADYIRNAFGIAYGQSAATKLLHSLGFSLIRPTTHPAPDTPNPEAEENYKKTSAAMANPKLILCFEDEVHLQLQPNVTRKWCPKGSKPQIKSKPGKESVAYYGFVFPGTGTLHMSKASWFNYETTIDALRDLIKHTPLPEGVRICVVLDNASWHTKAIRLIWRDNLPEYEDIREKMCYLRLPPYCPHLNPIEQVWRITRREVTHNHYYPDLATLTTALDTYFAKYAQPNEKFRTLCNFNFLSPAASTDCARPNSAYTLPALPPSEFRTSPWHPFARVQTDFFWHRSICPSNVLWTD